MRIQTFQTYLAALQFVVGDEPHYFTASEFMQLEVDAFSDDLAEHTATTELPPEVASTLAEFALDASGVAGVSIGTEEQLGYVLLHYTSRGDIVRFIGFKVE